MEKTIINWSDFQSDIDTCISQIKNKAFDLVIDDGSHLSNDILNSFLIYFCYYLLITYLLFTNKFNLY